MYDISKHPTSCAHSSCIENGNFANFYIVPNTYMYMGIHVRIYIHVAEP